MDLENIEGIGPKTKELLKKLNIINTGDLLKFYPYRYDIIKRSDLQNIADGDKIIVDGIIEGQPTVIYINKSLHIKYFKLIVAIIIFLI